MRIWRGLDSFNMDSKFSTWAYRLTTNVCIDHLRKSRNKQTVSLFTENDGEESELPIPDQRYSPEAVLDRQELQSSVNSALEQLEPQYRQILSMRELSGMSYGEIADLLGIKEGTVKSRIARARERMRRLLSGDGNFFEGDSSDNVKGGMRRG